MNFEQFFLENARTIKSIHTIPSDHIYCWSILVYFLEVCFGTKSIGS